ncbi:SCP2 sterol-binding domain-containing protein [Paraneptunicella aestuarii]|uniref:ubiquinone biosynthesis accessory factor UbiJ n=1 Tax=Paraneptunicella aestuarii TaxID=2831148 RepID=UPI001E56EBE6|nr:SCP2 sterol-binding domain-containing protein [Paraneptunicella aestuarii]UAA38722.1 SCP2 sterol-binding domain-containing protein [Paraneptunicella aestuarii]
MPAPQLFTAAIETAFNKLIALDEQSAQRLVPLNGKHLKVTVKEFPWPLIFAFSSHIDVLTDGGGESPNTAPDCHIKLSLDTLKELQDSSQITRLIQEKRLELDGDIHVAQHFSVLVKDLDIDWEEQLSRYVGDVAAHQIWSTANSIKSHLSSRLQQLGNMVREGAIEEKQLAPHPIAMEGFIQDVSQLRSDVGKLEARIASLTNKINNR